MQSTLKVGLMDYSSVHAHTINMLFTYTEPAVLLANPTVYCKDDI